VLVRFDKAGATNFGDHVFLECAGMAHALQWKLRQTGSLAAPSEDATALAMEVEYMPSDGAALLKRTGSPRFLAGALQAWICDSDERLPFQVRDVGIGGLGGVVERQLQKDEFLSLNIRSVLGDIAVRGQVRYCRPQQCTEERYAFGVSLQFAGRIDKARWRGLLLHPYLLTQTERTLEAESGTGTLLGAPIQIQDPNGEALSTGWIDRLSAPTLEVTLTQELPDAKGGQFLAVVFERDRQILAKLVLAEMNHPAYAFNLEDESLLQATRQSVRVGSLGIEVTVMAPELDPVSVKVLDVSEHGLQFVSENAWDVGSRLEILAQTDFGPVSHRCDVRSCEGEENCYRIGICFLTPTRTDAGRWQQFVERLAA